MKKNRGLFLLLLSCYVWLPLSLKGQSKALIDYQYSTHVRLEMPEMGAVRWTGGFWMEKELMDRDSTLPHLVHIYMDSTSGHAYQNFQIAAGLLKGEHQGPVFQDGDFYKLLEAASRMYAQYHDPSVLRWMDSAIAVIGAAQRPDGYLHSPVEIFDRAHPGKSSDEDGLNFEAYNMGHLMTAACIHYRATGSRALLDIAIRAADYMDKFYNHATADLSRSSVCPSHYMGLLELFRTTRNETYLNLANRLIALRGHSHEGTDDNQDRTPFLSQHTAIGHAVRANYLYAGVADLYAEEGRDSLMGCLKDIWQDVVSHKIYITGGCGAIYDGVSPDGTSYNPKEIQKIQQAYGRPYELPDFTAHNETCAAIGNLLWNERMLAITADVSYADMAETELYNGILSGVSLNGKDFFYTNPLSAYRKAPYRLRWSGLRSPYIALSDCCPPNVARTLSEVSDYAYSLSKRGIWCQLYGANRIAVPWGKSKIVFSQSTDYPWNGVIHFKMEQVPKDSFSLFLRIPSWCHQAIAKVNGIPIKGLVTGTYKEIRRIWKKTDEVELTLPMPVEIMEANPMVESDRGLIAVKRGPIVYCLEMLGQDPSITRVSLDLSSPLLPEKTRIASANMIVLKGRAILSGSWDNALYRARRKQATAISIPVRLIPYFAWGNRGLSDMAVWIHPSEGKALKK